MTLNAREEGHMGIGSMPVPKKQAESLMEVSYDLVRLVTSIGNSVYEIDKLLFLGDSPVATGVIGHLGDDTSMTPVQDDISEARARAQTILLNLEDIISRIK